jgi:hypothetical protein
MTLIAKPSMHRVFCSDKRGAYACVPAIFADAEGALRRQNAQLKVSPQAAGRRQFRPGER